MGDCPDRFLFWPSFVTAGLLIPLKQVENDIIDGPKVPILSRVASDGSTFNAIENQNSTSDHQTRFRNRKRVVPACSHDSN